MFSIDDQILNDYRRRAAAAAAALRDAYDGSQAARQERAETLAQHHRNRDNFGSDPHPADLVRLAKLDRDLEVYAADERKLRPELDYANALFGVIRDFAKEAGHDVVR
ncbi:hypothetical protein J2Y55_004570 [Bosea sp. BE125]|uniref:hypothetical protein n=1 Tax=Bosea sp. BE125 TaxID=2817909 RepID=UPI00285BA88A|nr:hypothetical protein [Bosea sp. BE125]MDR6873543.1 hypothetical protein [Bosea sp. BE125]